MGDTKPEVADDGDENFLEQEPTRSNDREVYERVTKSKIGDADDGDDESDDDGDADGSEGDDGSSRARPSSEDDDNGSEAKYAAALRALKRAKTPQRVIDQLSREELLAWGEELSPVHDEVDGAFDELARRRKGASDGEDPEDGEDEAKPSARKVTLDRKLVTPLVQALGLGDDEEAIKAVTSFGESIAAQAMRMVGSNSSKDEEVQAMKQVLESMLLKQAREEMSGEFPDLKDDDRAWKKTINKYSALWRSGLYKNSKEALKDAAKLTVGVTSKSESSDSRKPRRSAPAVSSRPASKKPAREEADMRVFKHLRRNPGDVRGARRAAGIE